MDTVPYLRHAGWSCRRVAATLRTAAVIPLSFGYNSAT